ncbi:F-box domain-containing protein [Mycena venus]|uniref:F-box domain-containing protein n=1 Tax=Mycena venus TaxID=2733690 RepID=A0A8H6Y6D4_9AGAR|nr:F-box domain-containing protein [Mycena venus]
MILQQFESAFLATYPPEADPPPHRSAPHRQVSLVPKSPFRRGQNLAKLSRVQILSNGLTFSKLSLDVILIIMSWCGPRDLLMLRHVCKVFRALLAKNLYIWRLARANLQLGFPLPVAAPSEEWFIHYVLDSCPCTVCRRPTSELPYSFSLGIRICSVWAQCAVLVGRPENLDEVDALMLQPMPYLEWSADAPLYRPSGIQSGLEEFRAAVESQSTRSRDELEKESGGDAGFHGKTVQKAASGYRTKKTVVEKHNRSLLAALARENKVTLDQFITPPTLVRHVNAFAADLACMTRHAWETIRIDCLSEIQWLRTPKSTILCPLCKDRKQKIRLGRPSGAHKDNPSTIVCGRPAGPALVHVMPA